MAGKRRRRRNKEHFAISGDNVDVGSDGKQIPGTIRAILGPRAKIFPLPDFIRMYAPSLPKIAFQENSEVDERIHQTWVSPSEGLTVKTKLRSVSCHEALHDLVDDVIWNLVQQRTGNRNVLAQGFVIDSAEISRQKIRPCLTKATNPGILCKQVNDNVSFCKTSPYAKRIHSLIGDDMMRLLLLHTSIFLPVAQARGNYLLLSGPALQNLRGKRAPSCKSWRWDQNAVIPRSTIFYNSAFSPKIGLPSPHVLNGPVDVKSLAYSIFPLDIGKGSRRIIQNQQEKMLTGIFGSHTKCDYARILNRFCPLPEFCTKENTSSSDLKLSDLALSHTPNHGVISFLRTVLKKVFPREFWGSSRNFHQILQKVEVFVFLRRREQFTNKKLMEDIKVKDVHWLWREADGKYTKSDHEVATLRLWLVMRWVFCRYLVPLLRSLFYVTESEFSAKLTLYYRKPVWSLFRCLSVKKLLSCQYSEISREEAIKRIHRQGMGFSRLRLFPKQTGVRPVAMLNQRVFLDFEDSIGEVCADPIGGTHSFFRPRKKRRSNETKYQSTNFALENTFEVLRYERSQKPHIFGSGIYGLNELMPLFCEFLAKVRSNTSTGNKALAHGTQLYFASVDIQQCYDNIRQDHLFSYLPALFSHDHYLINKHAVFHPFTSMGRISRRKIHKVGPPEEYIRFHKSAIDLSMHHEHSIFVDTGGSTITTKNDMLKCLEEHLFSHLILIDGRYGSRMLLQKRGIPQGSKISSLLCNFYYCQMEQKLLSNTGLVGDSNIAGKIGQHLLVRIVDDFLLITTNRDVSLDFVQRMSNGSSELGVYINKQKTLTSYSAAITNSDGSELLLEDGTIKDYSGSECFPWCGLLFDRSTGEVHVDYSRFAHRNAIHGLTIDRFSDEGKTFEIRIKSFVRPRCQSLLFDPEINSPDVIASNFYQMMMLSAIKSGEYLRNGLSGGASKNPIFLVRCIDNLVRYSHRLITSRIMESRKRDGKAFLGKMDCFFLTLDGFHFVLSAMKMMHPDFACTTLLDHLSQRILRAPLRSDDLTNLIAISRQQFNLAKMLS